MDYIIISALKLLADKVKEHNENPDDSFTNEALSNWIWDYYSLESNKEAIEEWYYNYVF